MVSTTCESRPRSDAIDGRHSSSSHNIASLGGDNSVGSESHSERDRNDVTEDDGRTHESINSSHNDVALSEAANNDAGNPPVQTIQYQSHLSKTDGCVIIEAIPNSPPFPSRPQKLDKTDFKRYVAPKLTDNVKRSREMSGRFC